MDINTRLRLLCNTLSLQLRAGLPSSLFRLKQANAEAVTEYVKKWQEL
jgi:hypothetical protein